MKDVDDEDDDGVDDVIALATDWVLDAPKFTMAAIDAEVVVVEMRRAN
jgi:hypothetical protein